MATDNRPDNSVNKTDALSRSDAAQIGGGVAVVISELTRQMAESRDRRRRPFLGIIFVLVIMCAAGIGLALAVPAVKMLCPMRNGATGHAQTKAAANPNKLSLSAICITNSARMAIINDKIYSQNDTISAESAKIPQYTVAEILPNTVILEYQGKRTVLGFSNKASAAQVQAIAPPSHAISAKVATSAKAGINRQVTAKTPAVPADVSSLLLNTDMQTLLNSAQKNMGGMDEMLNELSAVKKD